MTEKKLIVKPVHKSGNLKPLTGKKTYIITTMVKETKKSWILESLPQRRRSKNLSIRNQKAKCDRLEPCRNVSAEIRKIRRIGGNTSNFKRYLLKKQWGGRNSR